MADSILNSSAIWQLHYNYDIIELVVLLLISETLNPSEVSFLLQFFQQNKNYRFILPKSLRCNSLPRKISAYHTPDEMFERELDKIYQMA